MIGKLHRIGSGKLIKRPPISLKRQARPQSLTTAPKRQLHLSPRSAQERASNETPYAEDEEDEDALMEELSEALHVVIEDDFLQPQLAKELRETFDSRFKDPRQISPERFMWDYWHVPNQYTLIRTQAQVYFPLNAYEQLVDSLISFGEERLGCRAISPIWCSYYIEGCLQELHTDSYHGPFAFVLSLTQWEERMFRGGETMVLKPTTVDYWSAFDPGKGLEQADLVDLIPPLFNRLTVFDPRFPHGVKRVSGTNDPREARIVLHGWFTTPEPFFSGGLSEEEASPVLQRVMENVIELVLDLPCSVSGLLSIRFTADRDSGIPSEVDWLADTLIAVSSGSEMLAKDQIRAGIQSIIAAEVSRAKFPPSSADTVITLPIVFS